MTGVRRTLALVLTVACAACGGATPDQGHGAGTEADAVPASVMPPEASAPPAEVVSADACPFEGCRLGDWVARRAVPIYRAPRDASPVSTLAKGDRVSATTGEVHATPRKATVTKVYSTDTAAGIDVGDTVYALYPLGEGALAVWHDGVVKEGSLDLTLEYDAPLASRPLEWIWWVRVRLADGTNGWLRNPQGQFDGMDALAKPH